MDKLLIAVDMDGTLLNSRNQVTEYTLHVLQNLMERGCLVVPATGRALTLLPKELSLLCGMQYAVLENGAFIWDYVKEQSIYRKTLPKKQTENILKAVKIRKCYAEIFVNGAAYADICSLQGLKTSGMGKNFIRYFSENHTFIEHLEMTEELTCAAEKINLYFEDAKEAQNMRSIWNACEELSVTTSAGGNVEITPAGDTKGNGLKILAEKIGIPKGDIIAIGDNENDLEMFAQAGCAVAMGNADRKIRMQADYVTLDYDHEGVAVFLENYIR